MIAEKIIEGVSRTKVRLVAQGFEEMDGNTIRRLTNMWKRKFEIDPINH